jgi:methyl-accepting chemotaxis protein
MQRLTDLSFSSGLLFACGAVPALVLAGASLGGVNGPVTLWLISATMLGAALLIAFAARSARTSLTQATAAAQRLAHGDYDEFAGRDGSAAFTPLADSLQALGAHLRAERERAARERAQSATVHALVPNQNDIHGALLEQLRQALTATRAVVDASIAGDLTQRVQSGAAQSEELRAIASAVNALIDNMGTIVRGIHSTAGEVRRAANEIAAGNENLSQRTEEQSSSLEETASSMEQMTTTVKQNADNAAQANQLALAAREQAERGGVIVNQAITAMSDINQASKKIADIIGVIDEIAFQTNLLALNAAVEAARAGEQGRGFAVVASEVRSLAGRSATAAKEIKGLIQDSVRKVEDGSARVTQSGQTLVEIVASVKKVSDIVAEIAAASREQSSGIEQVNRAVMQMDELTQQNATLVEQASESARSLSSLTEALESNVARYRLSAENSVGAPAQALRRAVGG